MVHHDIPVRPLEIIGADMFNLNNKHYLCIVDYHSKFPIIKKTENLSADSLILMCKVNFAEYGLPKENNVKTQMAILLQINSRLYAKA